MPALAIAVTASCIELGIGSLEGPAWTGIPAKLIAGQSC